MLGLQGALAPWGIRDATVTPTTWGLNNRSWFVDSPAGRHVLRVYSVASPADVSSEHELLRELASARLPFATPRAAPALDGSTVVLIDAPAGPRAAALYERIDGDHLDDEDVGGVEAAGTAFAELDHALATLRTERPILDARLAAVHPLVPHLDRLEELGSDAASFVRRMAGTPSELRGSLQPRQLIHNDFAFGNVLLKDGRVVGVLDFEFATHEARGAELAIALRLVLSKSSRDRIWQPLLRGYLSRVPLTHAEIAALPALALHHEAVVLVWWLGRYRSGNADRRSLDEHIARALALEPWLAANGREVVREARTHGALPR